MHCRVCDFPLWNLTASRCPECATPFDWRTYRFRPATVALACPKCNHRFDPQATYPDPITCNHCHACVPVKDLQVVPITDDPRHAQAIQDLPVPPYKFATRAWWILLALLILEIPGAAVPFVSFVGIVFHMGGSKLIFLHAFEEVWLEVFKNGVSGYKLTQAIEFFAAHSVFAGLLLPLLTLRYLIPVKLSKPERLAGYLYAGYLLASTLYLSVSLMISVISGKTHTFSTILFISCCLFACALVLLIACLALFAWRRRIPSTILLPLLLHATAICTAVLLLPAFGLDAYPDIGWWIMAFSSFVYVTFVACVSRRAWVWHSQGRLLP